MTTHCKVFAPGADAEHPHAVHGESRVVPHGVQVLEVLVADVASDVVAADKQKQKHTTKEIVEKRRCLRLSTTPQRTRSK